MNKDPMNRVKKSNPCPVCKKTDWCLIGKSLVLCMRVPSPREKELADGSKGWLHPLEGFSGVIIPRKSEDKPKPPPNLSSMLAFWSGETKPEHIKAYAKELGVSVQSLTDLGAVRRTPTSWAFPMRDDSNHIIGVRIRCDNGKKFAVPGSHGGLFIPEIPKQDTVYLPEGPTSTAACLTLGLFAIGRPNANGAIHMIVATIKKIGCKKAVIVADTDVDRRFDDGRELANPGATGAITLSQHMTIPNCTLLLPVKDMRLFVERGGTVEMLNHLTSQCIWRHP